MFIAKYSSKKKSAIKNSEENESDFYFQNLTVALHIIQTNI